MLRNPWLCPRLCCWRRRSYHYGYLGSLKTLFSVMNFGLGGGSKATIVVVPPTFRDSPKSKIIFDLAICLAWCAIIDCYLYSVYNLTIYIGSPDGVPYGYSMAFGSLFLNERLCAHLFPWRPDCGTVSWFWKQPIFLRVGLSEAILGIRRRTRLLSLYREESLPICQRSRLNFEILPYLAKSCSEWCL